MGDEGGLYVSVNDTSQGLDRAIKLLAGIRRGAYRAISSAAKRAAVSGKAAGAREVANKYTVSIGNIKSHMTDRYSIAANGSGVEAKIVFNSRHITLLSFDTGFSGGKVAARVKRDSARKQLERGFFGGNGRLKEGVWVREGSDRYPIMKLSGPAPTQAMTANPDVADAIADKVWETFETRVDHEISAILNGWRT